MKGTEIITRDRLISLGACSADMELFDKNHPDGQGEYQTLLDEACRDNHGEYASWLLAKIGPTEDVLEADEIKSEMAVVFAGTIRVKQSIEVGCFINVGGSINAGGAIKAGVFIKAGFFINAGAFIEAEGVH